MGIMNYFPKVFVEAARAVKAKHAQEDAAAARREAEQQSQAKTKGDKGRKNRDKVAKDEPVKAGTGDTKIVAPKAQKP